ncbi:Glycerophosphodiester phosphodiesterase domain-containing protein, partial [Massariosphaeria phaeospora]
GTGQNTKNHEHIQIGENTLEAFETATKLGTAFIEVYVQVTKDLVPVVYHDFLVSETGTDSAIYSLSKQQSARPQDADPPRLPWDERARPRTQDRRRTRPLHAPRDSGTQCLFERMKHTFEYKMTGMKGNTRSNSVHEPFMTLRQLLDTLPESTHLDIELKYPMLFETDDWEMDPYAMELNLFTDSILQVLFTYGGNRSMFLSTFSPELCILLVRKQKTYPVLFLNDSNNYPTGDPRALSLQSAVHFARAWKLQGIIMASEPFIASPKLVKFVQGQKLFCASYGGLNDDPECAKIQADAGIDAIIVNKVKLITKTLQER